MKELVSVLGELRHRLLFLHVFTGCDTTSRPFGIGQAATLKKLKSCPHYANSCPQMQTAAQLFLQEVSLETVQSAGEKVLVMMYGRNPCELRRAPVQIVLFQSGSRNNLRASSHTFSNICSYPIPQSQSVSAGSRMAGKLSDGGTKTVWLEN